MRFRVGVAFYALAAVSLALSACGAGAVSAPQTQATCPPPAPSSQPFLAISYPEPNATAVPVTIGELIFVGFLEGLYGNATVSMESANGVGVPVGAPTSAPSPMPTPFYVPPGWGGNIPFVAIPVPTLAPSTTYTVTYRFTDYNGVPPSCVGPVTRTAGSFTTK
jgi:hypothetical protein